ncbi:MAG: hypothetical protein Kow0081_3340 [Candidatus Dojkabacteria bacterium]
MYELGQVCLLPTKDGSLINGFLKNEDKEVGETKFDQTEDVEISELTLDETLAKTKSGEIYDSGSIVIFYRELLKFPGFF